MKNSNNIYSEYKIDEICSSNKSYEERIDILNRQKDNILEMSKYIEEAKQQLEDGKYLDEMIYRKDSYKKQAVWDAVCVALSAGVGFSSLYFMEKYNNWGLFLYFASIGLGAWFLAEFVSDLVNYNSYNYSVNSYQRRLK